ncbi:hypothetical protein ACWELP_25355 [Rhodococcus aetherivorans]
MSLAHDNARAAAGGFPGPAAHIPMHQQLEDVRAELAKCRERNRELVQRNDQLVRQVQGWADDHSRLTGQLDAALRSEAARQRVLDTWCTDPLRPYLPAIHLITALETAL